MILEDSNTKTDFEQEMKRFLPQSIAERTVLQPTFWEYSGKTIQEEVETVIRLLIAGDQYSEFTL